MLAELRSGNKEALAKLIPLVDDELHRLAEHYMRDERVGHTLQPTALIDEAYLRLASAEKADWQHRAHFVAVAAGTMRRVLIDHARKQLQSHRGTAQQPASQTARLSHPREMLCAMTLIVALQS